MVPQVVYLGLSQLILLPVEDQAMLLQQCEHLSQVCHVLLVRSTSNQHIIRIAEYEGQARQHLVHQPLESLPSISEAKGHP